MISEKTMAFLKLFGTSEMKELVADSILGILKLKRLQRKDIGIEKVRKTSLQKRVLQELYKYTDFPSTTTREELALLLGLPYRSIQVWFQNKRQKHRKNSLLDESYEAGGKDKGNGMEHGYLVDTVVPFDTYDIPTFKLIEIIEFCQEKEQREKFLFFTIK